ncbi:MAG: fumarylacetoacetate hydrolase family protein [Pikeienuella sp.]
MKYLVSGGAVWALAPEGGGAVNLSALDPAFGTDMMGPITLGREAAALRAAALMVGAPRVDIAKLAPDMPLARPGKILCLGHNYVDHVKEGGYDIPEHPAIFVRTMTSMTPAETPMLRPKASPKFDFEVELMIVIGREGRAIAEENALDHIFGYTIFNDGSIRDFQRRSHQWTPGKNFDRTGAVGPIVTDAGELGDAGDLKIESRLNGQVMQSATTRDMMWPVPAIIRVMSEFSTLEPGDMIATGTPPGVGHARKPPVFMTAGDVIECEVEGVGICRNSIEDEG